jgi:hypothetical protein
MKKQIPEEIKINFLSLIFESNDKILIDNFFDKYFTIKLQNLTESETFNKCLIQQEEDIEIGKNIPSPKSVSLQSMEEINMDNSIDSKFLYEDLHFNESGMIQNDQKRDSFSIVRPINQFNYDKEMNLAHKQESENNFKNIQIKKSQMPYLKNNNSSNNNLLNTSSILGRSGINQKIQEVFSELNRTNSSNTKLTTNTKPIIKLDRYINKIKQKSNTTDDYFFDFCKSLNYTNCNSNLRNVSDRILNINNKYDNPLTKSQIKRPDKLNSYKFFTLEKMLKTGDISNKNSFNTLNTLSSSQISPNLLKSSSGIRMSNILTTGGNTNFELLEEQLDNLYRKNQNSKSKNLYSYTLEPKKSSRPIIDQLIKSKEEKDKLANELFGTENHLNTSSYSPIAEKDLNISG